jgi:hypothetical protein
LKSVLFDFIKIITLIFESTGDMSRPLRFKLQRSASADTINVDAGNGSNHSNTLNEYTNAIDRVRSQLERAASFSELNKGTNRIVVNDCSKMSCKVHEKIRGRIVFSSLLQVAPDKILKRGLAIRTNHSDKMLNGHERLPNQENVGIESNVRPQHDWVSSEEQRLQKRQKEDTKFVKEAMSPNLETKCVSRSSVPQRGSTRRSVYNNEHCKREDDRRKARAVSATFIRAQKLKKEFAENDNKRSSMGHPTSQRKKVSRLPSNEVLSSLPKPKISLHTASTHISRRPSTTRLPRRRSHSE